MSLSGPEWDMGDTAQKAWGIELAKRGNCVLPAYSFSECVPETKAPVMLTSTHGGRGLLVTPDILSLNPCGSEPAHWHEVKAKSEPSWHRNLRRWEHGFDYDLLSEYEEVQGRTGVPVWIVVHEVASPEDPENQCRLVPSGCWLVARLAWVKEVGEHRAKWPGGWADPSNRGRRGRGGWLWPRSAMKLWKDTRTE